jgi:hypothetical protein
MGLSVVKTRQIIKRPSRNCGFCLLLPFCRNAEKILCCRCECFTFVRFSFKVQVLGYYKDHFPHCQKSLVWYDPILLNARLEIRNRKCTCYIFLYVLFFCFSTHDFRPIWLRWMMTNISVFFFVTFLALSKRGILPWFLKNCFLMISCSRFIFPLLNLSNPFLSCEIFDQLLPACFHPSPEDFFRHTLLLSELSCITTIFSCLCPSFPFCAPPVPHILSFPPSLFPKLLCSPVSVDSR